MTADCLLSIDIGTSSTKVLLAGRDGSRIAQHTVLYGISQPYPGYAEQDADAAWWQAAKEGIAAVLNESRVNSRRIAGICASGMVPNLCPLDADGRPIRPAILYRDNRAYEQVLKLKALCGYDYSAEDVIPKLLWLKENEPASYSRMRTFLNAHSYLVYKLTGSLTIDHDIASIHGGVYDIGNHAWLPEKMEQIGLCPSLLPTAYWPTDIVGSVTAGAAAETGLAEGTPVLAGTGDSYTACVGSGTVSRGDSLIYLGTAATMIGLHTSCDDARGRLFFSERCASFLANVLTGGEISRWAKDALYKDCGLGYEDLENAAKAVPAGSEGLFMIPHLLGERTPTPDPTATGVLFGLSNAHTTGHIYRAMLEGVACALRESLEASGFDPARIVLFGGGSKCRLWRHIIANVLDRRITYCPDADNALGTAFLAGMGLGFFDSFDTIREKWLHENEMIEPDPAGSGVYQTLYPLYQELTKAVRPVYRKHHKVMAELADHSAS